MKELKPVHTPSPQHREFRSLVKYRKTLDGRINKTKNAIRAWFVNHGISIDAAATLGMRRALSPSGSPRDAARNEDRRVALNHGGRRVRPGTM